MRSIIRRPILLSLLTLGLVAVVATGFALSSSPPPACGCSSPPPKEPSDEDNLPGTPALLTGDWADSCEVFTVEPIVDYVNATLDDGSDSPLSGVKEDSHPDSESIVQRSCTATGNLGSYQNRKNQEEEAFFHVEVTFTPESSVADAERIFDDVYERSEEEFGGSNDFLWKDSEGEWDAGLIRGTWSSHPGRDLPTAVYSWWFLQDEFLIEGELMFDSTERAEPGDEFEVLNDADELDTVGIEHYEDALGIDVTHEDIEEFLETEYMPQIHTAVLEALER